MNDAEETVLFVMLNPGLPGSYGFGHGGPHRCNCSIPFTAGIRYKKMRSFYLASHSCNYRSRRKSPLSSRVVIPFPGLVRDQARPINPGGEYTRRLKITTRIAFKIKPARQPSCLHASCWRPRRVWPRTRGREGGFRFFRRNIPSSELASKELRQPPQPRWV
jgi:hypothetical protein